MFIQMLVKLAELDLAWYVHLLLGNLLWVFIFIALGHFIAGGDLKKGIYAGLIIALSVFVWMDFGTALGIPIFVGSFLLINYIAKLSSLILAHDHPDWKPKMVLVNELVAIAAVLIYFIFIAGG